MLFVTSFARTVGKDHRGAAGPEYGGIRYIGIRLLPVGVVMCDRPGSRFRTSPLLYADEKGKHSARSLPRARMREGVKQSVFSVCLSVRPSGEKF